MKVYHIIPASYRPALLDDMGIVGAFTKSWLHSDIIDSLLLINAFNLFRKDRGGGRGGRICIYLSNSIPCKRRLDLENPIFQCLWLTLHPKRLPRPLSDIASCGVYHPPG